jgi:hypothetical protein
VGLVGFMSWVCVLSLMGDYANGLNQLAAVFNDALKSMLPAGVAANNKWPPGLRYSLADSYALAAGTDVAAVGFVNGDSACCSAGPLNAEADCLPNAEDLLLGLVCASNWSIVSNERLTIFFTRNSDMVFLTSLCRIGFDNSTNSVSCERSVHYIRVSPSGYFKRVTVLKKRGSLSCD